MVRPNRAVYVELHSRHDPNLWVLWCKAYHIMVDIEVVVIRESDASMIDAVNQAVATGGHQLQLAIPVHIPNSEVPEPGAGVPIVVVVLVLPEPLAIRCYRGYAEIDRASGDLFAPVLVEVARRQAGDGVVGRLAVGCPLIATDTGTDQRSSDLQGAGNATLEVPLQLGGFGAVNPVGSPCVEHGSFSFILLGFRIPPEAGDDGG